MSANARQPFRPLGMAVACDWAGRLPEERVLIKAEKAKAV